MEQHAAVSLAEHDALGLLLQHECITQHPRLICSLLCTSKAIRLAISQQCQGQLPLECCTQSLDQAAQFAFWISRWAGLAKSLDLEWNRISLRDVETVLQQALQQASLPAEPAAAAHASRQNPAGSPAMTSAQQELSTAAGVDDGLSCSGGPLQLKALKANVAGPLLLGQLPAKMLTCLELGHVMDYAGPGAAAAALAQLTGLQSLTVLSASSQLLLPAAASLTCLTHACLLMRDLAQNAEKLQHLPPSLRKLELTVGWGAEGRGGSSRRPALPLGHLSGLQELRSSGYFALQGSDQLPPSLLSLQAPDCPVAQPLLHLTNLQTLNLYNSTTPASELILIGRALPQLSEISLGYFGSEEAPCVEAAAAGWPGLPLRSLDFDSNCGDFRLGDVALEALGRLGSSLTQLALSGGLAVDTTPAGLAMVLSRLTQLHTLRLASVELLPEVKVPSASGRVTVYGVPQRTTRQRAARLQQQPAGATAAPAGSADHAGSSCSNASASATTPAASEEVYSGAGRVMAAVASLASLRSLKLGGLTQWLLNPVADLQPLRFATQLTCLHLMELDLSDSVLEGLLARLTQLRELDVSDNVCVGNGALGFIGLCLPLLKHLDVSGSGVSEAGVKALKEALPAVDVVCFQSSEEEWL